MRIMVAVLLALVSASLRADTFEFLPVACRVFDSGGTTIPAGSILDFHVTPGGPTGAWQAFAEIRPPSGPAFPLFQNGNSGCGLPPTIVGAQLSVTIVTPDRTGHATLWPSGHTAPGVSQLQTFPGISVSEEVTVEVCQLVSCPFDVSMFMVAGARVAIDITGYLEP